MRNRLRVALDAGDDEEVIQACLRMTLDVITDGNGDTEAATGRTAPTFEARVEADDGPVATQRPSCAAPAAPR